MSLWLLALASASVQTLAVPRDPAQALRVPCPVKSVTRLLLPEPLRQLQVGAEARAALGISVERSRPTAVLRVLPQAHPAQASVEFRGPRLVLRLLLETAPAGHAGDVRITLPALRPATEPPASVPAPVATPAPATAPAPEATPLPEPPPAPAPSSPGPTPSPSPEPEPAPSPAPPVAFDLGDLVRATPVPIGRREGLPGQLPLVLVDALRGESSVWLRFTLEGGAPRRVSRVSWERGPITAFTQEPVGRDLRIVVQLPKAQVSRKSRLQLDLDAGASYRVGLNSSTLAGFLKSLFQ